MSTFVYHEIVPQSDGTFILRVYNRRTSQMLVRKTLPAKQDAIDQSVAAHRDITKNTIQDFPPISKFEQVIIEE